MSWLLVFALAAGAYATKALGLVALGSRRLPRRVDRCLALVPAALLPALVAKDTFSAGDGIGLDPRVAGVALAAVAAWRRAPFVVVVVLGAAVTALWRLAS